MSRLESWISLHGRLPRAAYLWRLALLGVLSMAIGRLADAGIGDIGPGMAAAVFLWLAGSLTARRLHDISRSAWMMAVLLLPILGPIWLLLLVLKPGAEGRNRYGDDPLARHDYFTVDIAR